MEVNSKVGSGRFTLVRPLGCGGMGEVWLAQDERLGEAVALKFLPPEVRADPAALDDLRRETARSHRLTHPNIVRIHDLHEEPGGMAFIAMEYVDGPTLAGLRLEQPGRVLNWEFLCPMVQQLCAALDYAHGEKVIHRDLKPANVMVDSKGRLKLADFGIAATVSDSISRVSGRQGTSGTLLYMSPQQLAGKHPKVSDDIYALGATLYELLTSKPPFYTGDITHQVLREAPEPLMERLAALNISNEVPPDVAAIIMACLAKESAQRPQSAEAVAAWIGPQVSQGALGEVRDDILSAQTPAADVMADPTSADVWLAGGSTADNPNRQCDREQVLWEGGAVFASYVPGLIWAGGWFVGWMWVVASLNRLIASAHPAWIKDAQDLRLLESIAPKACYVFYAFALLALWGVVGRVLEFFNAAFLITTHRIKIRRGALRRNLIQFEMREIMNVTVQQSLLGVWLNYGDVMLRVENRFSAETTLFGVADAELQMDRIRALSRTSSSGAAGIKQPEANNTAAQ